MPTVDWKAYHVVKIIKNSRGRGTRKRKHSLNHDFKYGMTIDEVQERKGITKNM